MRFRPARPSDAESVAAIHAESWRRHYRGAYSDAFLDRDVHADRLSVWSKRLGTADPGSQTIVAEDDQALVGFAHTVFEDDPTFGALLDNLHVVYAQKRRGVGSQLMALTARAVVGRGTGLYLWVLEQNLDAQGFYAAHGGRCVERAPVPPSTRLNGSPIALRYAWTDPAVILGSA